MVAFISYLRLPCARFLSLFTLRSFLIFTYLAFISYLRLPRVHSLSSLIMWSLLIFAYHALVAYLRLLYLAFISYRRLPCARCFYLRLPRARSLSSLTVPRGHSLPLVTTHTFVPYLSIALSKQTNKTIKACMFTSSMHYQYVTIYFLGDCFFVPAFPLFFLTSALYQFGGQSHLLFWSPLAPGLRRE